MTRWRLSHGGDAAALAIVDGTGIHDGAGPHYSRRTPGSKTFTGVGREVVLVTDDDRAVWAVVYQRTPTARGSGKSRGRGGAPDTKARHVWRNMIFRNLGAGLSSELIADAYLETLRHWSAKYGPIPPAERLRTEIEIKRVRSTNPGHCYRVAGWRRSGGRRGKIFLTAPSLDWFASWR